LILALGKGLMEALYVAVALTFSSTIIIVKLLSDKRELDSLHGRIAVGFLIVQDLAVVIAMMAMSALRGTAGDLAATQAGWRWCCRWAGVLLAAAARPVRADALGAAGGGGRDGALAGAAAGLCHRLGRGARRRWASGRASARRRAPSWPASRWPPPPTARR
jgi:hypothetical protein